MVACSVGYGKDSPPKNTSFYHSAIRPVSDNAGIFASQMNVIANEVVTIYSCANAADIAIRYASAITSKVIILPAPKVSQLSKYIHYNLITDYSIKKIEARARSSDILNQNRRC